MMEWLPGYPMVASYAELADYEIWFTASSPVWHRRKVKA
jgi:hypothetical protein